MPIKVLKERSLTIPEAKEILASISEEELNQFQRRAKDHAIKFSKIDAKDAKSLMKRLTKDFELEANEAVQIVNCMPENPKELRVFLAGGRRIVETHKLEGILSLLNEYRKKG
ncbi:MAG: RNA polymerase Rpb4 [Candidatus Aerophobus sp.]|nr:MAG: RNA polymerase Rpb4 [Candidatus Aerophobus sp.]